MGEVHPFDPVYDTSSRILILGSFPSVQSRRQRFYYGNPNNRFWKVLSRLFACPVPGTVEEKRGMLLEHHIALWDVIAECEIEKSADASIRRAVPNDISKILDSTGIRTVFANGGKAGELYRRLVLPQTCIPASVLPSTSPANAAWTMDRLIGEWARIMPCLKDGAQ